MVTMNRQTVARLDKRLKEIITRQDSLDQTLSQVNITLPDITEHDITPSPFHVAHTCASPQDILITR